MMAGVVGVRGLRVGLWVLLAVSSACRVTTAGDDRSKPAAVKSVESAGNDGPRDGAKQPEHARSHPPPCEGASRATEDRKEPQARVIEELTSKALIAADAQLAEAIAKAEVGLRDGHTPTFDPKGIVGVTIHYSKMQLGWSEACSEALRAIVNEREANVPDSVEIEALEAPTIARISDAYRGWERREGPDGKEPIEQLARTLTKLVSGVRVYRTAGNQGPSPMSGVALVDEATREALWVYTRANVFNYRR